MVQGSGFMVQGSWFRVERYQNAKIGYAVICQSPANERPSQKLIIHPPAMHHEL
jgi:hypothetical protein